MLIKDRTSIRDTRVCYRSRYLINPPPTPSCLRSYWMTLWKESRRNRKTDGLFSILFKAQVPRNLRIVVTSSKLKWSNFLHYTRSLHLSRSNITWFCKSYNIVTAYLSNTCLLGSLKYESTLLGWDTWPRILCNGNGVIFHSQTEWDISL